MNGVDLHIVLDPAPSAGWSPGTVEERDEEQSPTEGGDTGTPAPASRLVVVMLALSGRMDVEEPPVEQLNGHRAGPERPSERSADATLERLAMLGISFGL